MVGTDSKQEVIHSVNWGSLGYQSRYTQLLGDRVYLGTLTAVLFAIIVFMTLIPSMFYLLPQLELTVRVGFLVQITLPLVLVFFALINSLYRIDRQLRAIETYLDFEDRKYEVRHALYCQNHLHCLTLHYFGHIHTTTTKEP